MKKCLFPLGCLWFAPLSVLAYPTEITRRQNQGLDALMKANGKEYAGAATEAFLVAQSVHEETLAREFGSVT